MKNKIPLLFVALFALIVAGCQGGSSASDSSSVNPSNETSTNSESTSSTSSGSQTSSEVTSSEESPSSEPISSGATSEEPEPSEIPATLNIHYHRDDNDYSRYAVYLWDEGGSPGKLYNWDEVDDKWATKVVQTADFQVATGIFLIFRLKTTWDGQTPDAFIRFSDYEIVDGVMDVYCIIGAGLVVEQYALEADALGDRITDANFTTFKIIEARATAVPTTWSLYADGTEISTKTGQAISAQFSLAENADLAVSYEIRATFPSAPLKEKNRLVSTNQLYNLDYFKQNYLYTGNDLGATYTPSATTFKVWAPTSSKVVLHIYNVGRPSSVGGTALNDVPFPPTPLTMTRGEKGVFSATVPGDWNLKYYTYIVTNANGTQEVADPYAKSAGVNGLRGQIVDFSRYEPEGFDDIVFTDIASPTDLTVYELHVQDLTLHETWNGTETKRGKYLGLIEEGTTYTEGDVTVTTGFDHIKELGVNAVQLMPFYDQSNNEVNPDYNWGYNPQNYNVLEGAYSSNPLRGEIRIQEMKQVIKKFAENDIRIVMDVVYNHVASASASNFQKLVPGYYFRYNQDGSLQNASGVGNDFASEREMARKFIVDSVKFWAEEYQIKGFRFDLMGMINDQTLSDVDAAIKAIDGDIVLWGEPWSGGGYRGGKQVYDAPLDSTSVAAFNDSGRNGLKGNNKLGTGDAYGWVQKGPEDNDGDDSNRFINQVKGMLAGQNGNYYASSGFNTPSKTVNYAGCHDNYTLFDQMTVTAPQDPKNASLLANAIVLTSQGVPFFQGGDEIMRSKKFDPTTEKAIAFMETHDEYYNDGTNYYHGNSYNADWIVNAYLWEEKVDNLEYFEKYKELIKIRKDYPAFRMSSASEVATNFGYWVNVEDLSFSAIASWNTKEGSHVGAIYSFYAANLGSASATQTIAWEAGNVKVLFDSTGVRTGQTLTDQVTLSRYQTMIVQRIS